MPISMLILIFRLFINIIQLFNYPFFYGSKSITTEQINKCKWVDMFTILCEFIADIIWQYIKN